jgi:putative spermidine/putrescine transport system substrate-binding protein
MRKIIFVCLIAVVLLPWDTLAQGKKELVICQFGGAAEKALKESMFDPFEKETGIKVIPVTMPNAAKLKAMVDSKNVEWDIMLGAAGLFGTARRQGLLEKVDYKYFDQKTLDELYPEAKHEYGVGIFYFSVVMAYDRDLFKNDPPQNWADFWNVKKYPGPRTLHSYAPGGSTWEFSLMADGVPKDNVYDRMWPPDYPDMNRIWKKLDEIKPNIVKFWTAPPDPIQLLVDKGVVMAAVYDGRVQNIIKEGAPVAVTYNQGMLYLEYLMIPKGAPNYDNACKFMAFQAKAAIQAEHSRRMPYGPVSAKSFEVLPPEISRNLCSHPENKKVMFRESEKWYEQNMTMMIEKFQNWLVK